LRVQASVDRLAGMLLLSPRAAARAGVNLAASRDGFTELDGEWEGIDGDDPFAALAARRR
jgi:hypothetical protein